MMERAGLRSEVLRPFRGEPPATTGATARGIAPAPAAKAPRAEDGRASLLCPPGKPLFVPHTSLQALLLRPQGESCVPPCFLNTSTRGYNSKKRFATFRRTPSAAILRTQLRADAPQETDLFPHTAKTLRSPSDIRPPFRGRKEIASFSAGLSPCPVSFRALLPQARLREEGRERRQALPAAPSACRRAR